MRDHAHTLSDFRVPTLSVECEPCGRLVRQDAWFAILRDGTMSRHALSAKQKTDLHLAGRDRDGIVGPILASEHVNWPSDSFWSQDNWQHQESRDWDAQEDEAKAVKRVAEYAREWGFPFLHRGPKSLDEDECYWRAVPAGGILYETTLVPVSAEQSEKLNEIPRRQIDCTVGSPPHRRQRRSDDGASARSQPRGAPSEGAQVARPVYQSPIFLTAIRAIFANQRFGGASVGMGEARSNPFIDPLCGPICGSIGGNSV
jgi:hypothetical protein